MSSPNQQTNTSLTATLEVLKQLIEVVAKLRSPEGGCPWDIAQTPQSLIPYIIEEAYEVVDAIKSGNSQALAEELGDLLLQVVLQSQIASEYNQFTLAEVAKGISEKLIRRHPHVFGEVKVNSIEEIRQNWEEIKAAEKGAISGENQPLSSKLSRYARTLPPLTAGIKISQKAAGVGFEWDNVEGVWAKFFEEIDEFKQALAHESKAQQQAELGDILFMLINLARWYGLDPSEALHQTNLKFIQRFSKVEAFAERPLTEYTIEELETLWKRAKAQLAQQE